MAAGLDVERLSLAFQSRPDLVDGIQRAADSPARVALFNSIAGFVYDQLCTDEPALKRRKVDGPVQGGSTNGGLPTRNAAAAGATGGAAADAVAAGTEPVLLEIKDISLSIPQRKKFDLCFTKHHLYARPPGTTAPVQGLVWAWKDIEYVFCVPVPEKTQLQHNYVVFPRGTALASAYKPPQTPACEPLMFTVPATAPKPGSVSGPSAQLAASVSDAYSTLLDWALAAQLQSAGNASAARIVKTDAKVFHSVVRQAHRPSEQAVHVRAFRGSKDGYLFFLPTGILWGFKKPLLFVPLDRIAAVSYTNVLQRTFNVAIEVDLGGSDSNGDGEATTVEIEFGMLDHADYGGIDETYVRRHGLQDRSMAEQRKAKRELAENAPKAEGGGGTRRGGDEEMDGLVDDSAAADGPTAAANGGEDDGLTELQRAEMQLQDEEDELEEDYDPGSDGDSDGSGASSDEEDGEGEEGEDDDDDDDDDGGDE